jgi:hypothetical protein
MYVKRTLGGPCKERMGYIYMNIDARGNGGHTSTRNDYTLDSDVSSKKYMQSWSKRIFQMTVFLSHLGLGLAALGTFGCRCRCNVQVRRPIHTICPSYTVCATFLCPNKAVTRTLWGLTCEARGYSAGQVIVSEHIDND